MAKKSAMTAYRRAAVEHRKNTARARHIVDRVFNGPLPFASTRKTRPSDNKVVTRRKVLISKSSYTTALAGAVASHVAATKASVVSVGGNPVTTTKAMPDVTLSVGARTACDMVMAAYVGEIVMRARALTSHLNKVRLDAECVKLASQFVGEDIQLGSVAANSIVCHKPKPKLATKKTTKAAGQEEEEGEGEGGEEGEKEEEEEE
jgi:hypothetical protein